MPLTRPGSASGQWQKGVVDGHMDGPATAPGPGRRREVRDDAAHRRRQPPVHLGADAYRPAQDLGRAGIDGPIRAAVDVLVEPATGSREARKEMPANMAALKQNMEAG
jgi:hypothetical protein